jgi:hypothetical protein
MRTPEMNIAPNRKLPQNLRKLGPYFALALALPGGFLIVLLIWLFEHRHRKA